jgi:hypothetical protein
VQQRRSRLEQQRKTKWQPGEPPMTARALYVCLWHVPTTALRHSCAFCNSSRLCDAGRPPKPRELTAPAKLPASRTRHSVAALQPERALDYGISVLESPPFIVPPDTWKDLGTATDDAAAQQASMVREASGSVGAEQEADHHPSSISSNGAQASAASAAPAEGAPNK